MTDELLPVTQADRMEQYTRVHGVLTDDDRAFFATVVAALRHRIASTRPDSALVAELYYCTRCQSLVRETDDFGEYIAGRCCCDDSPSPWVSVNEHWAGLAPKFRPGGTALPKSIILGRGLMPQAVSVSIEVARELFVYLESAYERLAALRQPAPRADDALRSLLRRCLLYTQPPSEAHHRFAEDWRDARESYGRLIAEVRAHLANPEGTDHG